MKLSISIIALIITMFIFNYINLSLINGLIFSTIVYYVIYIALKRWLDV